MIYFKQIVYFWPIRYEVEITTQLQGGLTLAKVYTVLANANRFLIGFYSFFLFFCTPIFLLLKKLYHLWQNTQQIIAKEIDSLLKQFQKTKQWADIGNWLLKLYPIFFRNKFGDVPHKTRLAKRLAQSLNHGIPTSVHSNALNVYRVILTNFGNKIEMLPLLSIGLFPFF